MKLRIKNTSITTKIISWIQIVGGVYGIGLIIWLLLKSDTINGPILLIFLSGLSLFIFSIVSGRYLLSKTNLKLGLILTLINFILQIVEIKFQGSGFSYSSGINLLVGVEDGFKMNFGIISSLFSMSINSDDVNFILKFNIAAIIIIWTIADIYDELFMKKETINEIEQ